MNTDKYDKKRKKPKKIYRSLAHRIMTNILYAWYIEYNEVTRDKKWLIKKAWNISLRKWKHEWLISLETFDIIQKKLHTKRPYQKEALQVNDEYPLRRYIVCDCCGLPLTSGKSRSPKLITGPLIKGRNKSVKVNATPFPSVCEAPVKKKKMEQKANAIRMDNPNLTLLLIPPLIFKIAFS